MDFIEEGGWKKGHWKKGRWRKGSGAGFLFRFQNVRSPKYPAFTLWLCPVAAPSPPLLRKKLKGAAGLRP